MPKRIEITDQRFGLLTAVSRCGQDLHKRWFWRCRCDCGSEAVVAQNNLRSGNTLSCGCRQRLAQKSIGGRVRRVRGPDHYRWVKDRSLLRWRDPAVRRWVARVRDINASGCFKCGSADRIHIHHADGWSTHPSRRFDVSNGVPLCSFHHREYHRICGRDGSRQEDLHEYLGYPPIERDVIDCLIERPDAPPFAHIYDLIIDGELLAAREAIDREIASLLQ